MPAALANASHTRPRLLVADDDAASRRYLGDALRSLGAEVVTCEDGTQALQWARREAFDLLLLDCRMPGAGAHDVLTRLRADAGARSVDSLAVASTAEPAAAEQRALLAAGFVQVLRKPCGLPELQGLLGLLPGAAPVLDDDAALRASGDAATMQALRQLLRGELATLQQELAQSGQPLPDLGDRLHRLRSSCGFCGTAALAAEVSQLQRQLRETQPDPTPAIVRFQRAVQTTLDALDA